MRSTCVAIVLFATVAIAAADGLSPERQREVLRDSLNTFDQAVAADRGDPASAEKLYSKAAAGFEALCDNGVRSAAVEYNLANTEFRLGNIGEAIVHYRRAERLAPTDREIDANLAYARARVEPHISPTGERALIERLLFWQHSVSLNRRFWIAAVGSIVGWLGLMVWLRFRARPLLAVSLAMVVLGVSNAASVAWQLHSERTMPHAVVVSGEHTLRLGRGDGYDPAIDQPLGPGVELRIIEKRGDWVEVRLRDDQTGWLPASVVIEI